MPPLNETTIGREYWRSLDELAQTGEFQDWMAREFPKGATELLNPGTRRQFLKVMGASLAFAGLGLAGCRWPQEKLAPYAYNPPGVNPGIPKYFATAMELGGVAAGLLVTSYDGRPIKVEGNPTHPVNRGSASAVHQASLLEMYDPDRSQFIVQRQGGQQLNQTWDDFVAFATPHFEKLKAQGGEGLAVLSEATSSETARGQRQRLLALLPQAKWYEYEPLSWDNEREGLRLASGAALRAHYDLAQAERIVCLDADLLQAHPDALQHTREFANWRRAENGKMNRLYVAESALSITGAAADHRLALKPSQLPQLALALAAELAFKRGLELPGGSALIAALKPFSGHALINDAVRAMAIDLAQHRGKCLIAAGPAQPPAVHALVYALNAALGNAGRTVRYSAAPDPDRASHGQALAGLSRALDAGEVQTLLILGGNPAYNAPGATPLALSKAPLSIHLSLHDDETSRQCTWHLPRAHYLESWGDARAWDGTLSIVQPLIEPLYGGKTVAEVLALCCGSAQAKGYDLVRSALKPLLRGDFETAWTQALSDGVVPGTEWPVVAPALGQVDWNRAFTGLRSTEAGGGNSFEVALVPAIGVYDGRFANNGWLQELPDPLSKITWDNALLLSVEDAANQGLKANDVVRVDLNGVQLELPAYLMPGQALGCVAIALGYGRTASGRVGNKTGVNAYPLRNGAGAAVGQASLTRTGKRHTLAVTQDHFAIDAVGFKEQQRRIGPLVREGTLEEYKIKPGFAKEMVEHPPLVSLWTEPQFEGHRWGMAIDLSSCIGCGACVVACQAENNIPVVGPKQVAQGREMHWIRIDRYFTGDPAEPEVRHQPLACHQCELAPCESVCPVAATVHTEEGLNDMVYNRCVGTRYCSNNCPYKVRRFNFFNYRKHMAETEKLAMNPEVTVRSRGVMEKCTYCVQRIQAVKIAAKNDGRAILDGEIVPACAQTCPAQAIVFGDLSDTGSRVRQLHDHARGYAMLAELNVKPRTAYLAKLRNPAPGTGGAQHGHGGEPEPATAGHAAPQAVPEVGQ